MMILKEDFSQLCLKIAGLETKCLWMSRLGSRPSKHRGWIFQTDLFQLESLVVWRLLCQWQSFSRLLCVSLLFSRELALLS